MRNLFDYENKVMSTITRATDSIILGLLWLVCAVPIFTIGASSAAFYYAYDRCIRQEMDHAWKTFFSAFKSNFKQATQIWIMILGLILLAVLDYNLLSLMKDPALLVSIIRAVIIVLMLMGTIFGLYLFPYLSRFDAPSKTVIKNCVLIALANLPQSFLLLIIFIVCVIAFLCLPLLNIFVPSLYIFCANRIQEKIFMKYVRPENLAAQSQEQLPNESE